MSRESIFEASVEYFLAPIGEFLEDESVSEIMVNRYDQIYIERNGRIHPVDSQFESEDALLSAIHNVAQWVGRTISSDRPILDARLPDGSRVNAVLPPASRKGACLTIRRFAKGGLTMDDLIRYETLTRQATEFLNVCVQLRKNVLISGGTGTGKTSLLGAVSAAIPEEERIIVIEDTSELKLRQKHCLYLEVQHPDQFGRGELSIRELFRASLRMRPDRIIVGEVRGGEALDMVQSLLSGHSGSLSTVHANSPPDALIRLETLSLMSDVDIPVHVARTQVASAIDLVVQLNRYSADGSRRVTRITEIVGLDASDEYEFRDLFEIRMRGTTGEGTLVSSLEPTRERCTFAAEPYQQGLGDQIAYSKDLWGDAK